MKHTPGPWRVRTLIPNESLSGFFVEAQKTDPKSAYNIEIMGDEDYLSKWADAHLIAAAPEMLVALNRCIAALAANGAPNCEAVKEAKKVIAKAEGE